MSKIRQAFKNKKKCFIPFITAGDPNLEVSKELILAMAAAGADIIEIGIPFSDPVAEGEVIQRANVRALNAGTSTKCHSGTVGIFNLCQSDFYLRN